MTNLRILAAMVNHNTSAYAELMLRSLFATHTPDVGFALTVFDNNSTDNTSGLRAFAAEKEVRFLPSGYNLQTENNSHGDILRSFVLTNPDCDYYLFLDADVVFLQAGTIPALLGELEADERAFGIGPTQSWDGLNPLPEPVDNPDVYAARLHPCCALVKNSPVFRSVVEEVGLMCARLLWAERAEYLDTFKLMTRVMKTHGQHHVISKQMVLHFFCTSYDWDPPELRQSKATRRDALLEEFRAT